MIAKTFVITPVVVVYVVASAMLVFGGNGSGIVIDGSTGKGLPDVTVIAVDAASNKELATAVTNEKGEYGLQLPEARVTLNFSKKGYLENPDIQPPRQWPPTKEIPAIARLFQDRMDAASADAVVQQAKALLEGSGGRQSAENCWVFLRTSTYSFGEKRILARAFSPMKKNDLKLDLLGSYLELSDRDVDRLAKVSPSAVVTGEISLKSLPDLAIPKELANDFLAGTLRASRRLDPGKRKSFVDALKAQVGSDTYLKCAALASFSSSFQQPETKPKSGKE